ncbi:MAG: HupE/UreJ family protein [Nitrospirae bacterium]|nr:HupE/UreJ family protein [Nitrospirota bacterium]
MFLAAVLWIFFLLGPAVADAHEPDTSYTSVVVNPDSLEAEFTFVLSDLSRSFGFRAEGDQFAAGGLSGARVDAMYDYLETHAVLEVNSSRVSPERLKTWLRDDGSGRTLVGFVFSGKLRQPPATVSVKIDFFKALGKQHKNLVKIQAGDQVHQTVLTYGNPGQSFPLGDQASLGEQFGKFVRLGIEHIFLGYDHIMFLCALILIGGRFRGLVKIVTAFTVAHSLTLILAALQVVVLPVRLIESGIALSITYVACENFFVNKADHRWILTFFFGLVHGFGFANALRGLGLPTKGLVPSLLAFNAGVEVGQVCIVAALYPATVWIGRQRFRRKVVFALSSVILVFGLVWLVERLFGLSFVPV